MNATKRPKAAVALRRECRVLRLFTAVGTSELPIGQRRDFRSRQTHRRLVRVITERFEHEDFRTGDHARDPYSNVIFTDTAVGDDRVTCELDAVELLGQISIRVELRSSSGLQPSLRGIVTWLRSDRRESGGREVRQRLRRRGARDRSRLIERSHCRDCDVLSTCASSVQERISRCETLPRLAIGHAQADRRFWWCQRVFDGQGRTAAHEERG